MTLENFKKKNKPKKDSDLRKFQNEILELVGSKYSHESIAKFLEENGVKTTRRNVSKFIKKLDTNQQTKKETFILKDKNKIETEEIKKEISKENLLEENKNKLVLKTSNVKKFEIIEPNYSKFK